MPKKQAVFYCSFNLKKGASVSDFLESAKKLNDEYISKQKGYVAWQQLNDGDTWADYLIFETMEDVKNFENNSFGSKHLNPRSKKNSKLIILDQLIWF